MNLSIKTVSLYTSGMPRPARSKHGGGPGHVKAMAEARWAPYRPASAVGGHVIVANLAADLRECVIAA